MKYTTVLIVLMMFALSAPPPMSSQGTDPWPRTTPDAVGMSSARLARIATAVNDEIGKGLMPGGVLAIVRRGKLVYFETFGLRDKAAGVPMSKDTIFHIASMSKPMIAVAALQLWEQGKLSMDEPISTYFPAFGKMLVGVMDVTKQTVVERVPPARPITVADLLKHTSGLIYGGRGETALHKMYPASSTEAATNFTGPDFITRLASLPLAHQPGTRWEYGFGLDVLGLIVEKITGQPLGQYMEGQIWKPLGMTDTAFRVSSNRASRYAKAFPLDPSTGLPQTVPDLTKPTTFECGGSCVASTVTDYLRFATMLLNKGALGKVRILGRKSVEYMTSNQLPPGMPLSTVALPDYGFGLGVAVRTAAGPGSVGDFTWAGGNGTNWWVDPHEELAVVWMAHTPGTLRLKYRAMVNALVYQAIVD